MLAQVDVLYMETCIVCTLNNHKIILFTGSSLLIQQESNSNGKISKLK